MTTKRPHKKQQQRIEADIPGLATRQTAARLLSAVIDKKTSLDGLTDNEHGHPQYLALEPRDRALCRAILGSSLRHRATITAALANFLDRPLPANALSLNHILHIGCAQILYLDIPDHAAIDLCVTAAKLDPRNSRFSGLVNAVLRNIARHADTLKNDTAAIANTPEWFNDILIQNYGSEKAKAIIAIQNEEPCLDLTVKDNAQEWAKRLGGMTLPNGTVRIERLNGSLTELDGFDNGEWWVQDVAASLPARLMGNIKGKHIADLCAAPGGKTAQLAIQGAHVTALDLSANRLKRLKFNMERLGLKVQTWAGNLKDYQPEQLFDAVLLDAPCSSTGTIRRHPDVLWTKNLDDVNKLAALQYELLEHAINLTVKGGTIVFSNCSLAKQEGETLVEKLLATRQNITLSPIQPDELKGMEQLVTREGYLRTTPADLPHDNPALAGMDGFFAARLIKN